MIFKSINKKNSLIALAVLAGGFWALGSNLFKPVTMFSLFISGMMAILILKINVKELLKPIKKSDISTIFWGFVFSFGIAFISSYILRKLNISTATNPIHKEFGTDIASILIRMGQTLPQLLGEELITLLPFLMIIRFGTYKGMSEKKISIIALVITSIGFGLLHLPTYQWNVAQCLLVISLARVPFTLGYMKSKNVTVSWIIHVTYDWVVFILGILLSTGV